MATTNRKTDPKRPPEPRDAANPLADGLGGIAQIAAIAPRLRTPIQLAGFLFAIVAGVLIRVIDPNNVQALVVVAAFGVALVAIPLLIHPPVLKLFNPAHRSVVVLVTLALVLSSFGALAVVTASSVAKGLRPKGALFDSRLDVQNVRLLGQRPDGKYRVEIIWTLVPLGSDAEQSASVFTGIAVLHDDDAVSVDGIGQDGTRSCQEVPSCVGYRVFREYSANPVLVKAGTPGTTLTTVIDMQRKPEKLRVWWRFFQREGEEPEHRCGANNEIVGVADGIPPLAMFDRQGRKVADACYMSYGQRIIRL